MSLEGNFLTSPVADIQFMAVHQPITNSKDVPVYSVRLAFDTVKDAEWIEQIAKINPNKPVTEATYRGKNKEIKDLLRQGKTLISAETRYDVLVTDKEGNEMEEAPMFFADSKGQAQMIVQPYTKSEKGGTINLVAVIIHNLEGTEGIGREERLAQLREAVQKATS